MSSLPRENAKTSTMKQMSAGPLGVAKFLIGCCSKVTERDPPSDNKKVHVRFITISVSHYCEKARWVLDHIEARNDNPYYYTEDGHPPAFQSYATLEASNEVASITPMILYKDNDGKEVLMHDSTEIVKQFMPELYPEEIAQRIDAMEANLGKRLGPCLRCFAYYFMLNNLDKYHETLVQLCADKTKVAKVESVLFDKFLDKGLGDGIKKAFGITEETKTTSEKEIRQVFADISAKLDSNGGQYIMDTKQEKYGFTAADLTFAALSYPFLRPPQMDAWFVDADIMPNEINSLADELRETSAGKHVLKIYKEHRLPPNDGDGNGVVTMKYSERNKYPWQRA